MKSSQTLNDKLESIEKGSYDPSWESLREYTCPDWFRDAKLGLWAHWGPQAVPMCGDWYARNMYIEGHEIYRHHWRTYGHPSKFGWKDVIKLWKAENFDPKELMKKYVAAGAKYFCATAMHHDNFDMWDSAHNRWNSAQMGPRVDILKAWKDAAKEYNIPFGVTEHLGAAFSWWSVNKGHDKSGPYKDVPYDGNDPDYQDLYYPNKDEPILENQSLRWYTDNEWFHKHWFDRIKDLVDTIQPDLLYSDGPLPFNEYGLGIVAHFYNSNMKKNNGVNRAVYNQKSENPGIYQIGILDIECGVQGEKAQDPWQTDTCLGGWFYSARQKYKTSKHIIELFVDIVAKNGNLLLNIPIMPDGKIHDEGNQILEDLAKWNNINGEGIFETRPWHTAMEGPTLPQGGELNEKALNWTSEDFRFTTKLNTIYAFQMSWSTNGKTLIKSFADRRGSQGPVSYPYSIKEVILLGSDREIKFSYTEDGLLLEELPETPPSSFVNCFKIIY